MNTTIDTPSSQSSPTSSSTPPASSTSSSRPRARSLPADPAALLEAVLAANAGTADPRLKIVLASLIRHLHAFANDVGLTGPELEVGLDFLVRLGQASGPEKHEGILLSDLLGLSTLVCLHDGKSAIEAGGTEPALVGPFWRASQPLLDHGTHIASGDTPGARLTVTGRVVSIDGTPIADARVETWQASPKGLYENQDEEQVDMNLRGRFATDADGRFHFTSVRPAGYPVPTDGPCGELLTAQGRHSMRPAHLHFIVVAPGHKVLATQFFDEDDEHAGDDAVFGVVGSLLRRFEPAGAGADAGGYTIDIELRLEPGETRIPKPPLS